MADSKLSDLATQLSSPAGTERVYVADGTTSKYATLATIKTFAQTGFASLAGSAVSLTIADDGASSISLSTEGATLLVTVRGTGATAALNAAVLVRTGANLDCQVVSLYEASALFAEATGVLAGTTGSDGKLTISAHTDLVYFENRLGASRTIDVVAVGDLSGLVPRSDLSANSSALAYTVPWPYQGSTGAVAATAQRENWRLYRNHTRSTWTSAKLQQTTGATSGTGVLGLYRAGAANIIGSRFSRTTWDTASNAVKTMTLDASVSPGELFWACEYSEVATTYRCVDTRISQTLMGADTSMQPIICLTRTSIALADAAPSSAPALSALTVGNTTNNLFSVIFG